MNHGRSRRELCVLLGMVALWPAAVAAQAPVIGFLSSRSAKESEPLVAAFREGLKEAGYIEGQNAAVVYEWAENRYERLPSLVAELVQRRVAVIVAAGGAATAFASKSATSTIPIVFTSVGNPVEIGLVSSLGRPGGNVTGSDATLTVEMDAKRLELLNELMPSATTIGVLVNPNRPDLESEISGLETAARKLGLQLAILRAGTEPDINTAFNAFAEQGLRALLIGTDPFFTSRREQLVGLAAQYAIPTIYQWRDFVERGGLMSYGASLASAYRQAGLYAGRILKGAKPAELPVARPTKFELVVNLKTASALGLTIPPAIMARADEVIE